MLLHLVTKYEVSSRAPAVTGLNLYPPAPPVGVPDQTILLTTH